MERPRLTCDLCGKADATVHLTELVNDQTRELHLCEGCAHEKGAAAANPLGLAGLLAGLTGPAAAPSGGRGRRENPKCPKCGLTYEDFRKNGRLGCGGCYEAFQKYLAPLLKRVHGSAQYAGALAPAAPKAAGRKKPSAETLASLRKRLKEAVAAERYEEAARLRDRVHARQKKRAVPARKKRKT